jgi:hypothetical protein
MNDRSAIAFALEHLGLSLQAEGRESEADQHFQQAIADYLDLGDLWSTSRVLNYAGQLALNQRHWTAARQLFTQARQAAIEGSVQPNALDATLGLAGVAAGEGEIAAALDLLDQVQRDPASSPAARDRTRQLQAELKARRYDAQRQRLTHES